MRYARFLPFLLVAGLAACHAPTPAPVPSTTVYGTPSPRAIALASPAPSPSPKPSPSPTPSPHARTLVAMGASDVVGFGADHPDTEGWAPVLATLLSPPPPLTALGELGMLSGQMRKETLPQAIAAHPDLVVLWTGVNDINGGETLEAFTDDVEALLAGLETTHARVFVVNLPDVDRLPFFKDYAEQYHEVVPQWQDAVRAAGKKHHATVIDLSAYSLELQTHPDYLFLDGLHPSTKGYRRLAAIIAAAIDAK